MNARRAWIVAGALVACGRAPQTISPPPSAVVGTTAPPPAALQPRLDALDKLLQAQLSEHRFTGMVAAVATRGGLVWSKAYGARDAASRAPMRVDTLMRIGSVTKVITALAVLKLRDEGKLALDVPAATYLPELAGVRPATADSPPITLRHLMTHTSGLPREPAITDPYGKAHEVTEAEVLASLHGLRLEAATGMTFSYSNFGAALEGLIIARVAKRPYTDFVRDEILRPLAMTSATFDRATIPADRLASSYLIDHGYDHLDRATQLREGATAARGQLYATVGDLAQLATAELLAWPPRDEPEHGPVKRSTLRESQRTEGPFSPGAHSKGAGWFLEQTPKGQIVEHSGAGEGFIADLWFSTRDDIAFVVMINDEDPALLDVSRRALDVLVDDVPSPIALVAALMNDASEANAEHLVDPTYLVAMTGRGSLAKFAQLRKALGACTVKATDAGSDPATGTIACGASSFRIRATVDESSRLTSVLVQAGP